MENYVEDNNTKQGSAESIKSENNQQKEEIARLTEELKLTKSSVADFQVESKAVSSEKNIDISQVQKLQGLIDAITEQLDSSRINTEET